MFAIRNHFGPDASDYYTVDEMQTMVAAAHARGVTLNGHPVRLSWSGPLVSAFNGYTRREFKWVQLAQALNGAGAL